MNGATRWIRERVFAVLEISVICVKILCFENSIFRGTRQGHVLLELMSVNVQVKIRGKIVVVSARRV